MNDAEKSERVEDFFLTIKFGSNRRKYGKNFTRLDGLFSNASLDKRIWEEYGAALVKNLQLTQTTKSLINKRFVSYEGIIVVRRRLCSSEYNDQPGL